MLADGHQLLESHPELDEVMHQVNQVEVLKIHLQVQKVVRKENN